ncbi:MAG TPA: phosphoribosylformylglycinamidine synthase [Candidatus Borkfalkia excrementigallinarum]|uniref:Phosphoribosylformylglycinamidine synthase n=1 Tax=Candidatus Borkfalkia excrementigallinarum TaxID=2838506 RepID=A0A9D2CRZ2_9FIRM|nr:phosphoribosylformylglycinamidine synthase [Candidatus Borkfalkia excrementigallinarum]
MIYRVFVEKKENLQAKKVREDLDAQLGIAVEDLREVIRYDVEGINEEELEGAIVNVFSEPPVDTVYRETLPIDEDYKVFAIAFLDGQYDQRADSAAQCVQLLTQKNRPLIKCARVFAVKGVTDAELERIKKHLINPVESSEVSLDKPKTLARAKMETHDVSEVAHFIDMSVNEIADYHKKNGFAMSVEDLVFVRDYFKKEGRNPTETEVKVIDTYWSDHCRHTTFSTEIQKVDIDSDNPHIQKAYDLYKDLFAEFNAKREDKYPCLMDIATIAVKKLKKEGRLDNLDVSDEINACSVCIDAEIDGKTEKYLVMFKNETHNHPTEIEPFGGAATCLGGAIRDPLSGRTYVYQAMRVTGSADPREKLADTLPGKLPQRVITKTAAAGFSSYGNQIGLATGMVDEVYHPGYKAKRLETGFVVGGAKRDMVYREKPKKGDVIILLGGETGRDGCGGATGSSKAHDSHSVETCGAEVQKGNPLTERKLQRLFLNKEVTRKIKKCNDFGAGGVSVAIGELSDGLIIDLDKVPLKYEGLSGTELAISESQERMAVVVAEKDKDEFIRLAAEENLAATPVAVVTDDRRMKMLFKGRAIVDISRDFLDTNGVKQIISAEIADNATHYFDIERKNFRDDFLAALSDLNVCSKKGLSEMFDSTIGARSVYMPFGGKTQLTPAISMAAKICGGETDVATVSAYGYCSELMSSSPFTGAIYSIVTSVAKLIASGCDYDEIRLTFQEFFMRLNRDPKRWGVPLSALLGALYAQIGLGLGAIGGKDSMSGTFEHIDVPPTLISFALAPAKASKLITNVLEKKGTKLYWIPMHKDFSKTPDFKELADMYREIHRNIESGNIRFATVVENGGIAAAVAKSCFGNMLGFRFEGDCDCLLSEHYGEILVSLEDPDKLNAPKIYLGETTESGFVYDKESVSGKEAAEAFCGTLEKVFPNHAEAQGRAKDVDFDCKGKRYENIATKTAKPRVFIPVFPGTNCELDTARKFRLAGAECDVIVVKNRSAADIEESVQAFAKAISRANIIAFPGGFSGGDEPDGSGKFIATTFRNPTIAEQVMKLLNERDGLILGICNGFQALIKLGLVPYGEIRPLKASSPTLTYNNISRHVSTLVDIRVASNKSPWLSACKVGDVFTVPVSHGEGRIVAPHKELESMAANGQIATQYCDLSGKPTMEYPFNPNGSAWAIEGITSPDGRVYGKMGHTERTGDNLYKNCTGNFDMKLFESGVKYFR